jgi:peptidoglycan/LPS O-acetylase OafA/YrhL
LSSAKAELHRIPELDGIRGIAVLAVVVLHFNAPFAAGRPLGPLSTVLMGGWVGVDIFFVLSGYLITSILIATRSAENYFRAFYARRALRILPLYCVALAAYFWVVLPLAHRHGLVTGFREQEQVWYWTFLGNWRQGLGYNDGAGVAHFWSLAIEEQFYVLFSVLVMYVAGRRLVKMGVGMVATSMLLRAVLAGMGLLTAMSLRLTVLHLDPIAMGALLASSSRARAFASRWWLAMIAIGCVAIFLPLPAGLSITAAGLGAAGAVGRACSQPVPLLRMGVLRSLGKYSYAMYVIHDFLAGAVANLAKRHQGFGFMLACLIGGPLVSYGLAWLSWQVLEGPIQQLKTRFPYRMAMPEPPEVDRHPITG